MNKHGITKNTASNILFGAGIWCKNLAWDTAKSEWGGTIMGATSGGGKLTIKGEIKDIELDGATVKVKGMAVKNGGTATADVNFAEVNTDILKTMLIGEKITTGSNVVTGFDLIQDKVTIEDGDYIEKFGFVGRTANDKKQIIVIFDNALCTSGLGIDTKDKENSVLSATFESYAEDDADLNQIPVKIYYPSETAETTEDTDD